MANSKQQITPYFFLLPGFIFLGVWLIYPATRAVWMSLHEWTVIPSAPKTFIWFENYIKIFSDPIFWPALRNTLLYALVTVCGQILLGVGIAILVDSLRKGQVFFRVSFYLPVVTSWVVVSLLFKYLFNSSPSGYINFLLVNQLKILPSPIAWLNEAATAWVAIDSLGIWKGVGWTMVIILAALQSLPEECFDSASIDGANRWQSLVYIKLPLLAPTIVLVIIMLTIGAFQAYIPIALITNGGPLHRTEVMLSYMYSKAFSDQEFGYSSALAFISAAIVFGISRLQMSAKRKV
ncbi:MAG: sugar ABC transporter permease [Anaerolineaceae bacterium]|nr:sugar ABC transporter permease [Anaerolineaceae bacterium]